MDTLFFCLEIVQGFYLLLSLVLQHIGVSLHISPHLIELLKNALLVALHLF